MSALLEYGAGLVATGALVYVSYTLGRADAFGKQGPVAELWRRLRKKD